MKHLCGLLCFLTIQLAISQSPTTSFQNLTIKDGLVGDHVLCVFQDSKGFLWVGTFAGLHRYDGYTFKVFNGGDLLHHDQNLLASNTVYAIIEDKDHKLWFGTENGLSHYDPEIDSFTNYYVNKTNPGLGPSHDQIRCIYEDGDGNIWLGTYGGGLNRFDPKTEKFHHFKKESDFLPAERINDFYVDKNDRFWIGTEGSGLVRFDQHTENFTYYRNDPNDPTSISNDIVNSIAEDKLGKLWVGTWGSGVCRLDPQTTEFRRYTSGTDEGQLKGGIVRTILEDSRGQLWFGTFGGGLSKYDRATDGFTTFENINGDQSSLSNNILWTVFEDTNGHLWIGTYGSGLDMMTPPRMGFRHYDRSTNPDGLGSNQISSFLEASNGDVWIGTLDGGVSILDKESGAVERFDLINESPVTTVREIFEDFEKNIWIGTDKGLYYYQIRSKNIKLFTYDPSSSYSLQDHGVYCIEQDLDSSIWVGSWDSGLNKLIKKEYQKQNPKDARFEHFHHRSGDSTSLSSNKIWTIYLDKNGDIWCGTEKGLDKYDKHKNMFETIANLNVGRILEDEAGNLWIGSYGRGLVKYTPKTNQLTHYEDIVNIDIDLVLDLVADKDGNLWLGSIDGITKFNTRTEEFINLDLSTELKKNEFQINEIQVLSSGEFIIGGDFGIDIFNPQTIRMNESVPIVELTDFQIFNKSVSLNDRGGEVLSKTIPYANEIQLTYDDDLISFEFTTLYFASQAKHLYAYKLDGFEQEWNYSSSDNRKATYMNLEPGVYTFRVKGATREGNWSKERSIQVSIAPPFWNTWGFKIPVILVVCLAMIGYVRLRISSEKKKVLRQVQADKLAKEQEITKLTNEKLDAELEHKKKELASSTLYNVQKNEELSHVQTELKELLKELKGNPQEKKVKKLLDSINRNMEDADNWEHFEKNFNLLHDDFLKRFVEAYPKLTHKDMKICAFIRMNFDNKEIARMLNITPESLGVSRTRIRKKIDLDKSIYLNDLIMRF